MQLDLQLGRKTRDEATEKSEAHNRGFLELMREKARGLCLEQRRVTSDDLRQYAATKGFAPTHANVWGLVFRQPGWACVGHRPSAVVTSHAREVKEWKWVGDK